MVGALVKQVLAKYSEHIPQTQIDLLNEQRKKTEPLKLDDAFDFLKSVLRNFDRFYICIDAIDECNEKHKLSFLRLLSTISTDFKASARIFITGRLYMKPMVEKAFRTTPSAITLEAKEEDIRKYVLSQLEMDSNYHDMDDAFKKDIMDKIV
jgi:hypothetical protein